MAFAKHVFIGVVLVDKDPCASHQSGNFASFALNLTLSFGVSHFKLSVLYETVYATYLWLFLKDKIKVSAKYIT